MAQRSARYSGILRAVHWLTVLAIIVAYLLVELHEEPPKGSPARELMMQWHYLAGLAVLALMIPRILSRLRTPAPPITPPPAAMVTMGARVLHLALYAFLLVQPVLGLLALNYGGDVVTLPGTEWHLPALVTPSHEAKEALEEWHEEIGTIFYWVIGLHIVAALWHHFLVRDNTLRRMT